MPPLYGNAFGASSVGLELPDQGSETVEEAMSRWLKGRPMLAKSIRSCVLAVFSLFLGYKGLWGNESLRQKQS